MKRILLKISGEMLQGTTEGLYDTEALNTFAKTIQGLLDRDLEIAIVVGGGNIWRSRDTEGLGIDRVVSDYLGMTGTIMNAAVVGQTLLRHGIDATVFSPASTQIPNATQPYTVIKAREALDAAKVVLCGGGISLPYSTTDATAVQRGLELQCDTVIKATKVDGVYDKDPVVHADAKKFDDISYDEALRLQLNIMDHHALALARKEEVVLYICHMNSLDLLGTTAITGTNVHI